MVDMLDIKDQQGTSAAWIEARKLSIHRKFGFIDRTNYRVDSTRNRELQNTMYNESIYAAFTTHTVSFNAGKFILLD